MITANHASYGAANYAPSKLRSKAKDTLARLIQAKARLGFDSVMVTGSSGLLMAAAIAVFPGADRIQFIMVRKEHEDSHGCRVSAIFSPGGWEGHTVCRYIILDDFVASGRTLTNIINAVNAECCTDVKPVFLGVMEYDCDRNEDTPLTGDYLNYTSLE